MTVLVTGAAGFIGFHLSRRLLADGYEVVGVDNMNDYYDVRLKRDRVSLLRRNPGFIFHEKDLTEGDAIRNLMKEYGIRIVVHLAAQAGVRHSLTHPHAYIESNVTGFFNVLEACRHAQPEHLVFASSSSVYGANSKKPYSVEDRTDRPVSLYAATKKSNELMAHAYSHLFGIPATGLRLFTVYGPWGRPDMAYFSFARSILEGRPIPVFNEGRMKRDFTYIDDIVEGIRRLLHHVPARGSDGVPFGDGAPYRIYNIGNSEPVELMRMIRILERLLNRRAIVEFKPMQPGDVLETCADVDALERDIGFKPSTSLEEGLHQFVSWYLDYYGERAE